MSGNKINRPIILILILGIIFLIIGLWLTGWNNIRSEKLEAREKEVIRQEDYWNSSMMMFRYNSTRIKARDLKTENDELLTLLLIEKLSREYSEKLIATMADYIEFMQALADANGLTYPAFILEDYEQ